MTSNLDDSAQAVNAVTDDYAHNGKPKTAASLEAEFGELGKAYKHAVAPFSRVLQVVAAGKPKILMNKSEVRKVNRFRKERALTSKFRLSEYAKRNQSLFDANLEVNRVSHIKLKMEPVLAFKMLVSVNAVRRAQIVEATTETNQDKKAREEKEWDLSARFFHISCTLERHRQFRIDYPNSDHDDDCLSQIERLKSQEKRMSSALDGIKSTRNRKPELPRQTVVDFLATKFKDKSLKGFNRWAETTRDNPRYEKYQFLQIGAKEKGYAEARTYIIQDLVNNKTIKINEKTMASYFSTEKNKIK